MVVPTDLERLKVLWSDPTALQAASDRLAAAYGGDLLLPSPRADRPAVIANFVSTLDGVVSYATGEAAGGGEISGFFAPDRFVMGLLRARADAVLVGAGTVRAAPSERWTPDDIYPAGAEQFAELRRSLGLPPRPTTVVMTRSGRLDLGHPGLSDPAIPVVLATNGTSPRAPRPNVRVLRVAGLRDLLADLRRQGMRLLLCEGGPHLLGELLAAEVVDDLFLTIAPQVAGRTPELPRLALVEGRAFAVAEAPWWRLISLSRAGDHLFLRYRTSQPKED